MNRQTFKDVVGAKRSAFLNDVEDDDDDDVQLGRMRQDVEGEEDAQESYNEAGEVMEPFNLRGEREEGHFDENMNFVFKKEHGEVDAWLASMDEASMEKSIGEALLAKKREDAKAKERVRARNEVAALSTPQLKRILLDLVQVDETVKQAMNRLSTIAKPKGMKGNDKSSNGKDTTDRVDASKKLGQLIEVVDTLVSRGFVSVYDASHESIENSLSVWEYQALDGTMQGPFTSQQIAAWMAQGYFTGASAVMMRRCGLAEMHRPPASSQKGSVSATSASSVFESTTAKRKPVDEPSGATKKVKFDLGVKETKEDLLADLDDDEDDPEAPASSVKSSSSVATERVQEADATDSVVFEKGPWILSDDIYFGDVSADTNQASGEGDVRSSATAAAYSSSSSISSSEARRAAFLAQQAEDRDDDDDEGDDIDDDLEVDEGRTDRRRKSKSKNKDDGDDSD